MRTERYKQVLAICENNAEDFQDKINDALARIANPEIVFDNKRSFTAYITYSVRKNFPEDLLELLEMVDGQSHYCEECPYFVKSEDKRRKWGSCTMKGEKTKPDSRACESFYIWRIKQIEQVKKEFKEIPYTIE